MKTDYKGRFDELNAQVRQIPIQHTQGWGRWVASEPFHKWFTSALNLLEIVFGKSSPVVERFRSVNLDGTVTVVQFETLTGIFSGAADEYSRGYLKGIRRVISEEFAVDLCLHAENLVDEGHLESAAVLASAALEDCFKRRVEGIGGIDTDGKTLTEYIAILKANGELSGTSAKIASAFPKFRNAAMHADWTKIEKTEILTITAFVKSFVS
jgi:hypothetical protein